MTEIKRPKMKNSEVSFIISRIIELSTFQGRFNHIAERLQNRNISNLLYV